MQIDPSVLVVVRLVEVRVGDAPGALGKFLQGRQLEGIAFGTGPL